MTDITAKIVKSLAAAAAKLKLNLSSGAGLLAAGAVACALGGCGSTERVCQGAPQNVVVVPSTSYSDLATSRRMAPAVARQAVARAAGSCGRLLVGLQDARPEADLDLHIKAFVPQSQRAYNRNPQVNAMRAKGSAFAQTNLLEPLAKGKPSPGDPFLGALVVIARELHERSYTPATIVLIGSGLDNELGIDGTSINLAHASDPAAMTLLGRRLREFEPLLRPLAGSCVILAGAGAGSSLPTQPILASQALLGQALAGAHIGFVPTRSADLPAGCTRPPALTLGRPRPGTIVATLSSDVVFQLDSAALQPDATAVLRGLLAPLARAQAIQVDGYTDVTGGDAINNPLSQARAAAVAGWIEQHASVPASRVHARGLGSSHPVATNATATGRALNRRVVVTLRER